MRIGSVTDAHYDSVNSPEKLIYAQTAAELFKSEGVDLILGIGDMYDYSSLSQAQTAIPEYEAIWQNTGINTKFLMGNHDKQSIGYDGYLGISKLTPAKNFTLDIGDYRLICYANIDDLPGYPFIASAETLAWLTAELAKCQTGGIDAAKKIIICAHCYIYQDYPGDPEWMTVPPYSMFSYNAGEQRAIIEAAKAAGANLLGVFHGHAHVNRSAIVNGIQYYGFAYLDDKSSCAILDIDADDNIRIIGIKNQFNYNNLPHYYVSPDGDDTENKGLLRSRPWKTITKFLSSGSVDGKKLTLMSGIYRETCTLAMTGTADEPIVFDFEPGAKVSGANIVTGFTLTGSEYQVALATEAKVVIKDGVMLTEGTAGSLTSGKWDWVAGTLYLKDDPTGHVIEAGQRNTGIGISTSSQYITVNNPVDNLLSYGCNNAAIEISGTPVGIALNNPVAEMSRYGGSDSNTAPLGNVVCNNPEFKNNKTTGLLTVSSCVTIYRNVKASGNITAGLSITGMSSPKITGGLITGNGTGINLVTTGGAGVVISNVITDGNTVKGVNSTATGATEIKNSCIRDATNTWGSTVSTNNITSDPKLMSDDRLASDSPCINAGAWVSGPGGNMSGETDRHGHKIHGVPNIGVDQKAGSPGRGRKNLMGSSMGF